MGETVMPIVAFPALANDYPLSFQQHLGIVAISGLFLFDI